MQTFISYFNSIFPKKLVHRRVNARPPLPNELIREGQYLRDFHRELMISNSPTAKLQYKAKLATHKSKIEEFEKLSNASSLKTSKNPSKTAWNIINSRSPSIVSPSTSTFTIIRNGVEISNPKVIANILNTEFNSFSMGTKPQVIIPPINNNNIKFKLKPISPYEALNILKSLPNKFTAGLDEVPCVLLKQCAKNLAKPLCYLVNYSFETGNYPILLKKGKTIPIPKADKSKHRPVSINSAFSKIVEIAYYQQYLPFLLTFINPAQHGFTPKRSCITAMYDLLHYIY